MEVKITEVDATTMRNTSVIPEETANIQEEVEKENQGAKVEMTEFPQLNKKLQLKTPRNHGALLPDQKALIVDGMIL